MTLGMEVGLSPGDFVLDGDPAPTPKGAKPHLIFGPRLSWPNGCIVFDVDPCSYPHKNAHPPHPIFGPCLLWPNGWMDEDAAWYGSRPRPRPHCTIGGVPAPAKGAQQPRVSAHAYCGHCRPSQLLLSSCFIGRPFVQELSSSSDGRWPQ